jgi:hydroxymethylpyrimidine/phosphomethylpyrimidine kinase
MTKITTIAGSDTGGAGLGAALKAFEEYAWVEYHIQKPLPPPGR